MRSESPRLPRALHLGESSASRSSHTMASRLDWPGRSLLIPMTALPCTWLEISRTQSHLTLRARVNGFLAACDRGRLAVGLRMRLKHHVEPFAEDIGGAVDVRRLDRFLQRHHVRLQLGEALLDHFAAQLPGAANAPEVLRQDPHQLGASLDMCRRTTAVCPPMERTRFHALERSDTGGSQGSAPGSGVEPPGLLHTDRPPVLWPSTRHG